ncbi:3539_t:CDS:1, partial [Scutellospora calospora]
IQVCCDTYLALIGASHKYLENVIHHLYENGLEECVHSNTGRIPKNMKRIEVNYDVAYEVFKFLKNYSDLHGMPSPGQHFKDISMPIIFLSTNYNYISVYRDYTQAYKDKYGDVRVISKSTFTNIWKALILSLQFMSSKSDLYETCEMMKMDIQYATQYEKKLELTKDYLAHLNRVQEKCDYYNKNITTAIEDGKHNTNGVES